MIDGFEVVAQRLAADGNAMLDDLGRFAKREGVSLDRVRRVGQFDVVVFLKLRQGGRGDRAQPVELRLLLSDTGDQGREHRRCVSHYRLHVIAVYNLVNGRVADPFVECRRCAAKPSPPESFTN
jgi:hypothetical protein